MNRMLTGVLLAALLGLPSCGDPGALSDSGIPISQQRQASIPVATSDRLATVRCAPYAREDIVSSACDIDWGDGTQQNGVSPGVYTHAYAFPLNRTITIKATWCTQADLSGDNCSTAQYSEFFDHTASSDYFYLPPSYRGIVGRSINLRAFGRFTCSDCVSWDFGDGVFDNNDNVVSHGWGRLGTYTMTAGLREPPPGIFEEETAQVRIDAVPANADCQQRDTRYLCSCLPGFYGPASSCQDYDECVGEGGGHACGYNEVCTNTPGSYACRACPPGYRLEFNQCWNGAGSLSVPPETTSNTITVRWSVNPGPAQGGYGNLFRRTPGGDWQFVAHGGLGSHSQTVTLPSPGQHDFKVEFAYMRQNPCGARYCTPSLTYDRTPVRTTQFLSP